MSAQTTATAMRGRTAVAVAVDTIVVVALRPPVVRRGEARHDTREH